MKKAKVDREIIFMVEESVDGGFEAHALGYPIFTEAENLADLKKAIKDAVKCHFYAGTGVDNLTLSHPVARQAY